MAPMFPRAKKSVPTKDEDDARAVFWSFKDEYLVADKEIGDLLGKTATPCRL